jgi:hypothetical protein
MDEDFVFLPALDNVTATDSTLTPPLLTTATHH